MKLVRSWPHRMLIHDNPKPMAMTYLYLGRAWSATFVVSSDKLPLKCSLVGPRFAEGRQSEPYLPSVLRSPSGFTPVAFLPGRRSFHSDEYHTCVEWIAPTNHGVSERYYCTNDPNVLRTALYKLVAASPRILRSPFWV